MLTLDLRPPAPRRPFTESQGKCDTTWTERFANPECSCGFTDIDGLGPCATYVGGSDPRCVYCAHLQPCHETILRPFGDKLTGFIAGAGTWSRHQTKLARAAGGWPEPRWYEHGSGFAHMMMERYGVYRVDRNGDVTTPDPPLWDGDLDGTSAHLLKAKFLGETPLQGWTVPAVNVRRAVGRVPYNVRWVIVFAHSHFGQVAAIALAHPALSKGARRRVILITIDTPNRRGARMQAVYDAAARNINGRWVHLHSGADWGSRMRWMGARCFPWQRQEFKQAGRNVPVDDEQDHSGVVSVDMDRGDVRTWDRAMRAASELARAA